MTLRLESALELKKGDKVSILHGWDAPGKIKGGKVYTLQKDAIPTYPGRNIHSEILTDKILSPDDTPCNAYLPIVDERGRLIETPYIGFKKISN